MVLVVALGVAAFAGGAVLGALHQPAGQEAVERFASAWERGTSRPCTPVLRRRAGARQPPRVHQRLRGCATTATAERVTTDDPRSAEGGYRLAVRVATRVFGPVAGDVRLAAGEQGVDWRPSVFPGCDGERLGRTNGRGALTSSRATGRRSPEGQRASPEPRVAADVVGQLGPIPPDRKERLACPGCRRARGSASAAWSGSSTSACWGLPASCAPARARSPARAARGEAGAHDGLDPPRAGGRRGARRAPRGGTVVLDLRQRRDPRLRGDRVLRALQPPGSTFKLIYRYRARC